MITRWRFRAVSLGVAGFLAVGLGGCGGADPAPAGACAAVAGQVTTAAGGSTVNNYTLALGAGSIKFSNDNFTFYTGTVANQLTDVGPACLDTVTAWPGGGAGPLSVIVGDAYVARFPVTTIVGGVETTVVSHAKFVVKGLSGGVVTVVYVPHL